MAVAVTGVAGFIGSTLARRLVQTGEEVVGIDNFDPFYDRPTKDDNLAGLRGRPGFSFTEGSILDTKLLDQVLARGVDRMIHLAALAGVQPSVGAAARYMRVNVEGTTRLLEACRRRSISRVVVASSSSVYGNASQLPFTEREPCTGPLSPYAASKLGAEASCAAYGHIFGMTVTCLRYFTVYGPRQRPDQALHRFVRLALQGRKLPIYGDGTQARDCTYVDDVVAGTIAALDRSTPGFRVYNIGTGVCHSLLDIVRAVEQAVGRTVRLELMPSLPADMPVTFADIRRAQRELGYAPRVPLAEGISRFVEWYRWLDEAHGTARRLGLHQGPQPVSA